MSTGTRKTRKKTKSRYKPRTARPTTTRRPAGGGRKGRPGSGRRRSGGARTAIVIAGAVAVLAAIYVLNRPSGSGSDSGGEFAFEVGSPGPGEQAPSIRLPSTDGETFDLSSVRGQTVLLFFQEGLMCQPCFDQMVDIEAEMDRFRALGIDRIVAITTDPLDALRQKVADDGITTPVLSDPELGVSSAYGTNRYGMMGDGRNGHSFIVVGPDGTILWRADYGGPPDFTMYLPVSALVADLRDGLQGAS